MLLQFQFGEVLFCLESESRMSCFFLSLHKTILVKGYRVCLDCYYVDFNICVMVEFHVLQASVSKGPREMGSEPLFVGSMFVQHSGVVCAGTMLRHHKSYPFDRNLKTPMT